MEIHGRNSQKFLQRQQIAGTGCLKEKGHTKQLFWTYSTFVSFANTNDGINTSLAAKGALAHRLQHRTACNAAPPAMPHNLQHLTDRLIQNGQWGLEIGKTLGYWTLQSTFAK